MKRLVCTAFGIVCVAIAGCAQAPEAGGQRAGVQGPSGRETYPAESILNHEEGVTTLTMCVETDGRPTEIKVAKSSGFKRLDDQSLSQMARQRLKPAKGSDGNAMRVCGFTTEIEWELD